MSCWGVGEVLGGAPIAPRRRKKNGESETTKLFEKWHATQNINSSSSLQVARLEMVEGNELTVAGFREEGGGSYNVPRWGPSEVEESTM